MIKRRIAMMTVISLLCFTPLIAGNKDKPKAKVGEKAPDFTLESTDGETVSLSDYIEEDKMVILQWMNPDCPFCTRVHKSGLVNKMLNRVSEIKENVVHLEINSTHYMGPEKTKKYLKEHGVTSKALMDNNGKVGKLYGAQTTPHMFVIDKDGILRYEGAIDNSPKGKKSGEDRINHVVNAVKQIAKGEEVSPNQTKPYGCSVKYPKE